MTGERQPEVRLDPIVLAALREDLRHRLRPGGGGGGRRGAELPRRVRGADGAHHPRRRGAGARRLPGARARADRGRTPARRWARWSRAPTGWAVARPVRGGRWRRCWRPTGWVPACLAAAVRAGGRGRAPADAGGGVRGAGVRLHRRAVRGQRGRARRRAGDLGAGPAAAAGTAGPAARHRCHPGHARRDRPSAPSGRRRRRSPRCCCRRARCAGPRPRWARARSAAGEDLPDLESDEVALLLVPDASPSGAAARARRVGTPWSGRRWPGSGRARRTSGRCGPATSACARAAGAAVDTDGTSPGWCWRPTPRRSPTCGHARSGPARRAAAGQCREAHRDAARLAAVPRPARGGGGAAARAPPDRALPRGPARELYGDALDDPATVLELTLALGSM